MFCIYCGKMIPEKAEFCPSCGKIIKSKRPEAENNDVGHPVTNNLTATHAVNNTTPDSNPDGLKKTELRPESKSGVKIAAISAVAAILVGSGAAVALNMMTNHTEKNDVKVETDAKTESSQIHNAKADTPDSETNTAYDSDHIYLQKSHITVNDSGEIETYVRTYYDEDGNKSATVQIGFKNGNIDMPDSIIITDGFVYENGQDVESHHSYQYQIGTDKEHKYENHESVEYGPNSKASRRVSEYTQSTLGTKIQEYEYVSEGNKTTTYYYDCTSESEHSDANLTQISESIQDDENNTLSNLTYFNGGNGPLTALSYSERYYEPVDDGLVGLKGKTKRVLAETSVSMDKVNTDACRKRYTLYEWETLNEAVSTPYTFDGNWDSSELKSILDTDWYKANLDIAVGMTDAIVDELSIKVRE